MHDCHIQGGHFFVYKPQNFPFRCRRCNERFISSYTDHKMRQPWKCLIERCEFVACSPCSDILAEELAASNSSSSSSSDDEAPLQDLSMNGIKSSPEGEERRGSSGGKKGGPRRGTMESGGSGNYRDLAKDVVKPEPTINGNRGVGGESRDLSKLEKIEVDDEGDVPYEIPIFTRTARQAAAQAAIRRTNGKMRPVTRRGGEGDLGRV